MLSLDYFVQKKSDILVNKEKFYIHNKEIRLVTLKDHSKSLFKRINNNIWKKQVIYSRQQINSWIKYNPELRKKILREKKTIQNLLLLMHVKFHSIPTFT